MGLLILLAAAAAPQAVAQAAPDAPAPAGAERGVIAYPPSFFAEAKPISAYDMVLRVPGFSFDKGAVGVRGLAGASGNVLIDGQPPNSKNDALDDILKRIPATSVERIELIRGGAPGIDMEGRTILANVVRRQTAGFHGAIGPSVFVVYNGKVIPGLRLEGQWRWAGGRAAEISQVVGGGVMPNGDYGVGGRVRYNADGSVRLASRGDAYGYGLRFNTTAAYETPLLGGHVHLNGASSSTTTTAARRAWSTNSTPTRSGRSSSAGASTGRSATASGWRPRSSSSSVTCRPTCTSKARGSPATSPWTANPPRAPGACSCGCAGHLA